MRAIPGVEHVTDDGVYRRTIVINGDPGVIELWSGSDGHLLLRTHLPHWEGLIHLVDRVRRIACLDADLADVGLPAARAAAIRVFARAVAHDELHLDRSVGLDRLVAEITAIPGLGPWTAHYLALRLGEPDAFPASDLGLRRALAPDRPLTTTQLTHVAEAWRPWRAHVAARLWMAADPAPRAA